MLCTIYKITNKTNGLVYIGQTMRRPDIRWNEHLNNEPSQYIDYVLQKDKNNFTFEIIEQGQWSRTELDLREKYWINYYDCYDITHQKGYNSTPGGKGCGRIYDDEQIIDCFEYYQDVGLTAKYLHSSPQTIKDVLDGHNINYSDRKKQTVIATTEEGIELMRFPTITAAANFLYKINPSKMPGTYDNLIRKSIKEGKAILGYIFSKDAEIDEYITVVRKIEPQYGEIIAYCSKELLNKNILSVLNKNELCEGYIWEEIYPQELPFISRYSKIAKQKYAEFIAQKRKIKHRTIEELLSQKDKILYLITKNNEKIYFNSIDSAINYWIGIKQCSYKDSVNKIYNDLMSMNNNSSSNNMNKFYLVWNSQFNKIIIELRKLK